MYFLRTMTNCSKLVIEFALNNYCTRLNKDTITILAIESSCDDTSCAVLSNGVILSNIVAGQKVHEAYGGVVPELASRAHQQNIVPVVHEALKQAGIKQNELSAIAFTAGPGLIGSLLVGASFAKSMALALHLPLIEVNHMQAHIMAHFIDDPKPEFPFLCLTVSGGHTQLAIVQQPNQHQVIGKTLDDAAGEAFDKSAKILGLPYPGGPLIDQYAQTGNPHSFSFPQSHMPGLDYSFSGLKTAILYFVNEQRKNNPEFVNLHLNDLCASIQQTIVNQLINKLVKASKQTGIKQVALAGGVAANRSLREHVKNQATKYNWQTFIPKFEYCTDNAAMIAMAAFFKFKSGDFTNQAVTPYARIAP